MLDGVSDQVREQLIQARAVAREQRRSGLGEDQLDAGFLEARLQLGTQLRQHLARIHERGALAGLAGARQLEHVMHQILDRAAGFLDPIDEVATGLADRLAVFLSQQAGEAEQRDERRTEIVSE